MQGLAIMLLLMQVWPKSQRSYCLYVYLISSDDGSIIRIFVQINILERRAYVVSKGRVSVTFSYSFRCLTVKTATVQYIYENSFIENVAASKYREANKCNNTK